MKAKIPKKRAKGTFFSGKSDFFLMGIEVVCIRREKNVGI